MSEIPNELGSGNEEARSGLDVSQDGATKAGRRMISVAERFDVYKCLVLFVREQSNVRLVCRLTRDPPELLE